MNAVMSQPPRVERVHQLLLQGPLTKREIRSKLALPRNATERAILELQLRGVVEHGGLVHTPGRRRKAMTWKLTVEGRELARRALELRR